MAAYLELYHNGKLAERVETANNLLKNCQVCPRHCGINRLAEETGECHTGKLAVVSSYGPHFGEETPLVGKHGSGTIFFTNCNLKCLLCQNYSISQLGDGTEVTDEELARMMLALQARGCHNINLVSPTHVVPQILKGLEIAINLGLRLPLIYNSGGYDSAETLKILDGIIDIYMPDMKYSNEGTAEELSGIKSYPTINQAAIKEMHRQVGDLKTDGDGIAIRGLLIRHLVLPHGLAGTKDTMKFIAEEISQKTYVSLMSQYFPAHESLSIDPLNRRITHDEYAKAKEALTFWGLERGWTQG